MMRCRGKATPVLWYPVLFFMFLFSGINFGEALEIGFDGNGYLWHTLGSDETADNQLPVKMSVWFSTKKRSGLLVAANYRGDGSMFGITVNNGKLR